MLAKKLSFFQWFALGILGWMVLLVGSFGVLVWQLKSQDLSAAANTSYVAEAMLTPVRLVTLYQAPDVEVIQQGLVWLRSSDEFLQRSREYAKVFWPESAPAVDRQAQTLNWQKAAWSWLETTEALATLLKQSHWYGLVPVAQQQWLEPQFFTDAKTLLSTMSTGQKTWLVLFQNSDELRATGGFIGSYAKVEFSEGMLMNFEIQDIYQPDGQFQGFITAPAGVAKFLSSGKGMRLPDANWWPDFPRSAQTILQYFAFGNEQRVVGVVAVNLQLAEDLLRVFGPVTLPDYDVTVSADNVARVARADRAQFFPGSQQKAHFLTLLFNQLKLRVEAAQPDQLMSLLELWRARVTTKDWQWYSPDAALQHISERYGLAGVTAAAEPDSLFFQSIESNVGINKANAGITRTVDLQLLPTQLQVLMQFTNHQAQPTVPTSELRPDLVASRSELKNGLGYVNYQRFLVSPYLKVASIFVGDQSVTTWDEETLILSGTTLKQVGFVMTVPEATKQKLQIVFELDAQQAPVANLLNLHSLTIQKQSGLPATPYEVFWGQEPQRFVLESDVRLSLQQ